MRFALISERYLEIRVLRPHRAKGLNRDRPNPKGEKQIETGTIEKPAIDHINQSVSILDLRRACLHRWAIRFWLIQDYGVHLEYANAATLPLTKDL